MQCVVRYLRRVSVHACTYASNFSARGAVTERLALLRSAALFKPAPSQTAGRRWMRGSGRRFAKLAMLAVRRPVLVVKGAMHSARDAASDAGYSAARELMYCPCSLAPAMTLWDLGGCWHTHPSFAIADVFLLEHCKSLQSHLKL